MVAIKEQEGKIRTLFNWAVSVRGRSDQINAELPCFLEELRWYSQVLSLFLGWKKTISVVLVALFKTVLHFIANNFQH